MRRGMCVALVAAWLGAVVGAAAAQEGSALLEKGIYTEETRGDPSAAIPIYEKVLAESQANRQVMAQAHFHLALCHRKLKQDARARELLKQFVQQYPDQEALVAKAKPILEELTSFDPATLMPPDTFVYIELGSPGEQLEKVLKMLEGTPVANPLEVVGTRRAVTVEAPGASAEVGPAGAQGVPAAEAVGTGEAATTPAPAEGRSPGRRFIQGLLNPSMLKEFKKIRGAAAGIRQMGQHGYDRGVAVLRPGESDAIRGLLTTMLVASGQPGAPIEGMEVVQFEGDAACAFDDEVFIIAAPLEQLAWSVRQYKGGNEASLATHTSFASLAPASSRRKDALTVWADVARVVEAARPMIGRGQMRDLPIISALADVPNMEGAVARVRLAENSLVIEATLAYKPMHRSLFYDLIRTPPMSGAAFAAVPSQAAALVGMALQPPGGAADPSAGTDVRTALVRHVTGLDLGRELFDNIQEIVVFLDSPGQGSAAGPAGSGDLKELVLQSLGAVIVSRDPAQTRAVLDRLLALPETFSGQATTQPTQDRTEYPLLAAQKAKLNAYLGQEGHTTVLALDPKIRDAALEALRSKRSAGSDGPLAKALAESQGGSKVALVNVGGIFRLLDAANPPPPTTQPTTAPAAARPSVLAQLATAFAATTVRLETVEQDNVFTVRLTASDIPPLKDVFPLLMQLQQTRARVVSTGPQPPQERNKNLRRAAMDFLAALQKNDQAAAMALVVPNSPAAGKVQGLLATQGLATFEFQEMRRKSGLGLVLVHGTGAGVEGPALLIHLTKPQPTGSTWLVIDVESLPVGKATERMRELAPDVVPVTRVDLAQAEVGAQAEVQALKARLEEAGASAEVQAKALAALEQARAQAAVSVEGASEVTPPKTLQPTADRFVAALARRDQAAIKGLILPGSAAEKMVPDIQTKADFSTFRVREVRRNGPIGMAVALDDPRPGQPPAGMLVFHLRMIEEGVWRVFNVVFVPIGPPSQPATYPTAGVRILPPGTFEIHVKDADLRDVLHLLSTHARKSIVATKEVAGTVTVDLYGVAFPQALEALLTVRGFVYREKDGIICVYTPQQLEEVIKNERKGLKSTVVTAPLVQPSTQPAGGSSAAEAW